MQKIKILQRYTNGISITEHIIDLFCRRSVLVSLMDRAARRINRSVRDKVPCVDLENKTFGIIELT